jgi:hypothetical protein
MKPLAIINDGYNETAVIHEVPRLYPAVKFAFRPMLISQRQDYFKGAEKLTGLPLRRFVAGYLVAHLVSWDVQDAKGQPVPITVDNVLRLKEKLFTRLFGIVNTDEASDETPDETPAEKDQDALDAIKAAETGRTLQDVREKRERGNS